MLSAGPQAGLRIHLYLAHSIKIEVVAAIERLENLWTFPSGSGEGPAHECPLGFDVSKPSSSG
jgi:hypothetical protein